MQLVSLQKPSVILQLMGREHGEKAKRTGEKEESSRPIISALDSDLKTSHNQVTVTKADVARLYVLPKYQFEQGQVRTKDLRIAYATRV